jgi:hypothetical protein
MEAYPLQWPDGWPRTKEPTNARFKVSMAGAVEHLYDELDRLGATNIVVSSDMQVRLDGKPYAKQNRLDDEGVAVYFMLNGKQQCIPCDRWTSIKDNVRAVGLTVEALRGLDRWGAKEMVDAAFRGFTALPAGGGASQRPWHEVLGVNPYSSAELIRAVYHRLAKEHHPDHGGSAEKFKEIKEAYEEAKKLGKV